MKLCHMYKTKNMVSEALIQNPYQCFNAKDLPSELLLFCLLSETRQRPTTAVLEKAQCVHSMTDSPSQKVVANEIFAADVQRLEIDIKSQMNS